MGALTESLHLAVNPPSLGLAQRADTKQGPKRAQAFQAPLPARTRVPDDGYSPTLPPGAGRFATRSNPAARAF